MLSSTPTTTVPGPIVFVPTADVRRGTLPRTNRPSPFAPTLFFPSLRPLVTLALALVLSLALGTSTAIAAEAPPVVNINTADAATLAAELVGVGMSKAQAIVAYRDSNGAFGTPDELVNVRGIGLATVEKNRDNILLQESE